jgi:DNA-directed RNA polymerase subunit H (RpoH/RPB5)
MSNEYETEHFGTLYTARNNLIEMLEQRSYNVEEFAGFNTNELHAMVKNEQLDMLFENSKSKHKIYVKFFEICEKKPKLLNKNIVDDMSEDLYTLEKVLSNNDTLLIINNTSPNDTLKQHLKYLWDSQHFHITVINIETLKFNILKHSFVPDHQILSNEEDIQFRKKYNIKHNKDIPEISRFDPVSQIICLKPNEICRIIRPSKNAVQSTYYRICKNK